MVSNVTPVSRADLSGNTLKGRREDTPAPKKKQSKQNTDGNAAINILFPDAMRAVLEEQARLDPAILQNLTKVFFMNAATKYEAGQKVIHTDPIVKEHHVKNIVT